MSYTEIERPVFSDIIDDTDKIIDLDDRIIDDTTDYYNQKAKPAYTNYTGKVFVPEYFPFLSTSTPFTEKGAIRPEINDIILDERESTFEESILDETGNLIFDERYFYNEVKKPA